MDESGHVGMRVRGLGRMSERTLNGTLILLPSAFRWIVPSPALELAWSSHSEAPAPRREQLLLELGIEMVSSPHPYPYPTLALVLSPTTTPTPKPIVTPSLS